MPRSNKSRSQLNNRPFLAGGQTVGVTVLLTIISTRLFFGNVLEYTWLPFKHRQKGWISLHCLRRMKVYKHARRWCLNFPDSRTTCMMRVILAYAFLSSFFFFFFFFFFFGGGRRVRDNGLTCQEHHRSFCCRTNSYSEELQSIIKKEKKEKKKNEST